jgi:hypothetical protein
MERTLAYLHEYQERLTAVQTPNDLYGSFCSWQHDQSDNARHAQAMINNIFFPQPGDARRLDPQQPLTTAIGGFKGIVIFSANPHYNKQRNAVEQTLRNTVMGNRNFCEGFFNVAHADQLAHTQSIQWWKNAANFAFHSMNGERHDVAARASWNGEKEHRSTWKEFRLRELWIWAHANQYIGAADVLPFHSNEDGMTGLIEQWEDNGAIDDPSNVRRLLYAVATQTFKMVLRLRPRLILVVSQAGANVVERVMTGIHPTAIRHEDVVCPVESSRPWNHEHRYKLHHFIVPGDAAEDTHVLTIPNQLFSARGAQNGLGEVRTNKLPMLINGLLG